MSMRRAAASKNHEGRRKMTMHPEAAIESAVGGATHAQLVEACPSAERWRSHSCLPR
jgi:hypothetical protein